MMMYLSVKAIQINQSKAIQNDCELKERTDTSSDHEMYVIDVHHCFRNGNSNAVPRCQQSSLSFPSLKIFDSLEAKRYTSINN
jgi:hypothetical protein